MSSDQTEVLTDNLAPVTPGDRAAYHIRSAVQELTGQELYLTDMEALIPALRQLQEAVDAGAKLGRRAALLKARRIEASLRAQDASIIQRGPDPAADLLRAANQTVGG